jgi:hypothetical protein
MKLIERINLWKAKQETATLAADMIVPKKIAASDFTGLLDFPNPAKEGSIHGVYSVVVTDVEFLQYEKKYLVRLMVTQGSDVGHFFTLGVGDSMTVNAAFNL